MNNLLYESGLEVDCHQIVEPLHCCKCKKVLDYVEFRPNCDEEQDANYRNPITGKLMTILNCDSCSLSNTQSIKEGQTK